MNSFLIELTIYFSTLIVDKNNIVFFVFTFNCLLFRDGPYSDRGGGGNLYKQHLGLRLWILILQRILEVNPLKCAH